MRNQPKNKKWVTKTGLCGTFKIYKKRPRYGDYPKRGVAYYDFLPIRFLSIRLYIVSNCFCTSSPNIL